MTKRCQHKDTTLLTSQHVANTFKIRICHKCERVRVSTETHEDLSLEEFAKKWKEISNG